MNRVRRFRTAPGEERFEGRKSEEIIFDQAESVRDNDGPTLSVVAPSDKGEAKGRARKRIRLPREYKGRGACVEVVSGERGLGPSDAASAREGLLAQRGTTTQMQRNALARGQPLGDGEEPVFILWERDFG